MIPKNNVLCYSLSRTNYKSSNIIIIMETVRLMWNVVWAVLHPFIEIALAIVATAAFWVIMTIFIG